MENNNREQIYQKINRVKKDTRFFQDVADDAQHRVDVNNRMLDDLYMELAHD